jgi:hypothetical protein
MFPDALELAADKAIADTPIMDDAISNYSSTQTAALVAILLPVAEQAIVYIAANASELVNSTLTRLPDVADKVADVCPRISPHWPQQPGLVLHVTPFAQWHAS